MHSVKGYISKAGTFVNTGFNACKKACLFVIRRFLHICKKLGLSKEMSIMIFCTVSLFAAIFIYKFLSVYIYYTFIFKPLPTVNVSAMQVQYQPWQPRIKASGSLRAVEGINVTSEIAGIVQSIHFTPGTFVKKGDTLVQLNADAETAQLHSLEAIAELAKITYARDKEQFKANAVSQSTLDADDADLKNKTAQIAAQAAIVAKKTINAPFSGHLGVSAVNLGQYVNPGDSLVTLQALDPLYVDFFIPQKMLKKVFTGLTVSLSVDAHPNESFTGKITTINPLVDPKTRNVEVEAIISNAESKLLPGMFGNIEINIGKQQQFLTLPQTAITFNPYGEIVYVAKEIGKDKKDNPSYIAVQTFVKVGETRGDQIAILGGLKAGDWVVTSGQLKIKNGTPIVINNTIIPSNDASPRLVDQ